MSGQQQLNVKLTSLQTSPGGCAGNIAYNLTGLGHQGVLLTVTGALDDEPLLAQLDPEAIDTSGIWRVPNMQTAQATIITDPDGRQFTAFYPGFEPTAEAWQAHLKRTLCDQHAIFVLAPLSGNLMCASCVVAASKGIPIVWNPGQYADQLSSEEIRFCATRVDLVIGNGHEIACLAEHVDLRGGTVLQTDGPKPVLVNHRNGVAEVAVDKVTEAIIDPTGCGDALTAGIVDYFLQHPEDTISNATLETLIKAVESGISIAGRCLRHVGSQAHQL